MPRTSWTWVACALIATWLFSSPLRAEVPYKEEGILINILPDSLIEQQRRENAESGMRPATAADFNNRSIGDVLLDRSCGPFDPDCSHTIQMLLQQYKVGEIKVSSGANIEGASDKPSLGAAVRVTATGITADKRAGDIKIIGVDAVYSTQERGMRLRFTLADTDVLFFCKDADGKTKPPGTGLLGGCEPKGIFGVGGKVIQIQHDGTTSRTAARWLDLNVVFNLLNNANTLEYIKERLNLYAGGSLDTTWTGNTPHAEDSANTLVRGNIGIMGMIRTDDFHWEFRGLAELRPNIADPINDYSVIAGGQALYHMTPRPNTVVDIGVDAHYQRNSIPSRSFGPFASDRLRDSGFIGLLLSFPLDGPIEDDAAPLLDH